MTAPQPPLLSVEAQLFNRTFNHPRLGNLICWVPTSWLVELANPTPSSTTDLGNWGKDERVDWESLFENMRVQGMRDPFIVGVGQISRRVRLEAGNQRVRCCLLNNITRVPAVAYVGDHSVTSTGNGTHEGKVMQLKLAEIPAEADIMGPYASKTYHCLSDVLEHMPSPGTPPKIS